MLKKFKMINILKLLFAPYRLVDSCGSKDYYLTIGQAICNLPNCSPVAVVSSWLQRKIVLTRVQLVR